MMAESKIFPLINPPKVESIRRKSSIITLACLAVEVSQTHYSNLVSDLNRINDVVQTNRAEFHAQNEELGTEEMDAAGNVGDDLNVM